MGEHGTDIAGLRQELGALLRKLRVDAGKTQEELGSEVRRQLNGSGRRANDATSGSSLSRFEKGETTPKEAVLRAILTITGANPTITRQALMLLEQIPNAPRPSTPPPTPDTEQPPGGTAPGPPRPPTPPPATPPPTRVPRGRSLKQWLIPTAVVVVLGGAGAVAATQPWAPEVSSRPCTPPASTDEVTGTPSSRAVSSDGAAYAEFYRDQARFVLTDQRADGRSAVLLVKIDSKPQQLWSNCFGKTGRPRKDGTIAPPKIISIPGFDKNATIEFRTCAAESATQIIDKTCGNWKVDQAT